MTHPCLLCRPAARLTAVVGAALAVDAVLPATGHTTLSVDAEAAPVVTGLLLVVLAAHLYWTRLRRAWARQWARGRR